MPPHPTRTPILTCTLCRFHGTLDATSVTEWCRFCVSFVDVFRRVDSCATYLDVPLADGMAALRSAQESANLEEMLDLMRGVVSREAVLALSADAL